MWESTTAWVLTCTAAAAGTAGGAVGWAMFHPRSRLMGPLVCRGRSDGPPRVALTFDDGPCPESTPRVLDALGAAGVRATFFVIGRHAVDRSDLLRRIRAEGHLLGNHSFDHSYTGMFGLRRYWTRQIADTAAAIEHAVGRRPVWFRPPMGFKQHAIAAAVRAAGCTLVTWSRRALDAAPTTSEQIIARLADRAVAGDIIQLHDGAPPGRRRDLSATAAAVGPLVAGWRARGLEPVGLDELIDEPPYLPAVTCPPADATPGPGPSSPPDRR
jgi:peptidoglycan/xylan/chitin deacetylase (PgdA/CDA1 family)